MSVIQLLEAMVDAVPAGQWLVITDNLSTHHSHETRLAVRPGFVRRFIPEYARGLNLSEPWWKQSCGLALKDRRFEDTDDLYAVLIGALDYWNAHRIPMSGKSVPTSR